MKIYAHRGFSGLYPQNTMLAFEKAVATGCDGIELDVQLTKDGRMVIIHDEKIDDLTDGVGYVRDYTCEELRRFNAAAPWKEKFDFCPIPTFEEYCAWARHENVITNVELKNNVFYYEELEKKVMDTAAEYHLQDRVLISSFNHLSAISIKKRYPQIPVGALTAFEGIGNPGYYCKKYGFDYYHPDIRGLTVEQVESCWEHRIGINVWTIDNKEQFETARAFQCDSVITNRPDLCCTWMKE